MKLLRHLVNICTRYIPFPSRGSTLLWPLLRRTGSYERYYTKKLFNGVLMKVTPADHIQRQLFWHGIYEKEASLFTRAVLSADDNMIDIGANTGYYSLIAAGKIKTGAVIAFEPVSEFRQMVLDNAALNGFTNISVVPFAIGEQDMERFFFIASANNTGMSGLTQPENFSGEKIIVQQTTLDNWLKKNPLSKIRLIKIDTEGAEYHALLGMRHTLQQFKPILMVELMSALLKPFGSTPLDIYQFMEDLGYTAYTLHKKIHLVPAETGQEDYNIVFLPDPCVLPESIRIG